MITKKLISLLIVLLSFTYINSQTVLLEQTVDENPAQPKWGKNYRHYGHLYVNFGAFAGPSEANYKYGLTNSFGFGYRYKLKLLKHYAIGADLSLSFLNYNLNNNDYNLLPYMFYYEESKQKLRYKTLSLELYQRINFGKRGNYIGNYLDIGAYASYAFGSKYIIKRQVDDPFYTISKTTYKKLKFLNYYDYGLSARIGFNRWVIFAKYRIPNILDFSNYIYFDTIFIPYYPTLPKLLIGAEISLF